MLNTGIGDGVYKVEVIGGKDYVVEGDLHVF